MSKPLEQQLLEELQTLSAALEADQQEIARPGRPAKNGKAANDAGAEPVAARGKLVQRAEAIAAKRRHRSPRRASIDSASEMPRQAALPL